MMKNFHSKRIMETLGKDMKTVLDGYLCYPVDTTVPKVKQILFDMIKGVSFVDKNKFSIILNTEAKVDEILISPDNYYTALILNGELPPPDLKDTDVIHTDKNIYSWDSNKKQLNIAHHLKL